MWARITKIKKPLLILSVLIGCFGFSGTASAAGRLYISPEATRVEPNAEFSVAVRIEPDVPLDGVKAEIGYDASKLSFVSLDGQGTAFPFVLEEDTGSNPIRIIRGNSENKVSDDSLIVTLRFKTLAEGSTTLALTGDAGPDYQGTSPTVQSGAVTITTEPAPEQSKPGNSGQGNSGQGTTNGSNGDGQAAGSAEEDAAKEGEGTFGESAKFIAEKVAKPQNLLIAGAVIACVGMIILLIWVRRNSLSNFFPSPRDVPQPRQQLPSQQVSDADQLLRSVPGIANPNPGNVVRPSTPPQNSNPRQQQPPQ